MIINPYIFGGFSNTYSLNFDGVDESIDIGNITELVNVQNYSISFYMKRSSNLVSKRLFGKFTSNSNNLFVGCYSDNKMWVFHNNNAFGQFSATALSVNVWYHIVITFDGTEASQDDRIKIYVDGVDDTGSRTGAVGTHTSASTVSCEIAQAGGKTNIYYGGYLDEFAIYDYTLSSSNVTTIYNSGTVYDLDLLSTPPVHWYRMGEGSDDETTIYDVGTTAANDGTGNNLESGDFTTDVV